MPVALRLGAAYEFQYMVRNAGRIFVEIYIGGD